MVTHVKPVHPPQPRERPLLSFRGIPGEKDAPVGSFHTKNQGAIILFLSVGKSCGEHTNGAVAKRKRLPALYGNNGRHLADCVEDDMGYVSPHVEGVDGNLGENVQKSIAVIRVQMGEDDPIKA